MLALLGYAMILAFMVSVMTGRLSALVGMIFTPLVFGPIAGPGTGGMVLSGMEDAAPTGILLVIAVVYFGLVIYTVLFHRDLNGTGTAERMERQIAGVVPESTGFQTPPFTAPASIPFTCFTSNDPCYLGCFRRSPRPRAATASPPPGSPAPPSSVSPCIP